MTYVKHSSSTKHRKYSDMRCSRCITDYLGGGCSSDTGGMHKLGGHAGLSALMSCLPLTKFDHTGFATGRRSLS